MLATYQAKLVNNQIEWIDTPPNLDEVYVTVTVFPNFIVQAQHTEQPKRQPPKELQGLITTHGNIFDMSESYRDWENFQ